MNAVIDFAQERAQRRVQGYERKVTHVLDSNRRTIGRLFATGALFTRQGTKVGRDLLLAHQHMLRVMRLLQRLTRAVDPPAPDRSESAEAVFQELDGLLERTSILTHRTGDYLAKLKMD